MISKFDLAKALRDQAKITADANSIKLVTNGEGFSPGVNQTIIEEAVIFGDDNSIGLAGATSDMQIGIFQLSLHVPKNETKWDGLKIIDILQAAFPRELKLTFNSQLVVIMDSSTGPMFQNDTHFIFILSVSFSVIN